MKKKRVKLAIKQKENEKEEFEYQNQENDWLIELGSEQDAIDSENHQGEGLEYGMLLSPGAGDLGDESEDLDDLPKESKRLGNHYDPTLSSGGHQRKSSVEELGFEITDALKAGLGYGTEGYIEEEAESFKRNPKVHKRKNK